ncbi:decapping endonuclease targeting mRNA [Endocarpon pusillum]|uniref:Decapping nuclease n=1 Tax=Endocarpon pusillum TaxID=364733 RepID=A0A8H7ALC5_9EURO|nr:decapping endonuclease targeting mRNA [Endocarpon pusillum]
MASAQSFDIEPIARFNGASAGIRRPKEITCFSFDDQHKYRWDDSSLRYYHPPTIPADLNRGFDTFRALDDTRDDHLDGLVDTIALHEKEKGAKVDADIITWRGMMTKIMATPFSKLESWEMNATCFQGSIFIEENHATKLFSKQQQNQQKMPAGTPSQDIMSFWGYKFETLSLIPDTWDPTSREYIESRETEIVDNHAQYCSIVRTGFGKIKMIIGGEVDAVWDVKPTHPSSTPINYIELKTAAKIHTDRDQAKFERKLLKFWAQSFLLGVPKIIVGFRTKDGILTDLEEMETQAIPEMVKRGKGFWDGNICINFAAGFLEWLKTIITEQGVWRIRKVEKSSRLEIFKIEETGHGDILSRNFMDWRSSGGMRT